MNDLINRQAAIDLINDIDLINFTAKGVIRDRLRKLPPAQPEIIRCKECKYCEHWYADKGRCFFWHEVGIDVFEDGFCNYAERRADNDELV